MFEQSVFKIRDKKHTQQTVWFHTIEGMVFMQVGSSPLEELDAHLLPQENNATSPKKAAVISQDISLQHNIRQLRDQE